MDEATKVSIKTEVSKLEVAVKTAFGFFIGGAGGSVADFFFQAHGKYAQIDFHEMLITACGVGALTMLTHYFPSPTSPTVTTTTVPK